MATAAQEGRHQALAYLARITPGKDNQTEALRLLLALQEKKPKKTVRVAIDGILARQNSDGGWSQVAGIPSDAYATGQSLYALSNCRRRTSSSGAGWAPTWRPRSARIRNRVDDQIGDPGRMEKRMDSSK